MAYPPVSRTNFVITSNAWGFLCGFAQDLLLYLFYFILILSTQLNLYQPDPGPWLETVARCRILEYLMLETIGVLSCCKTR